MASSYPSVKLVTEPNDSTSTVLLDLYDTAPSGGAAPRAVLVEEFSLGAPSLEGEPDAIDPLYGLREITVPIEVSGTKGQTLALLSSLSRILLTGYTGAFAPGLWLRFQVASTTTPAWFRLLRPQPSDLGWDYVYTQAGAPVTDRYRVNVTLPAEPFAFGPLETLSGFTLNYDPTAGSNPMSVPLGAAGTIKGDAPAPARIESNPVSTSGVTTSTSLFVLHSTPSAIGTVNCAVGTGDGLTAGTDMGAGAAVANMVGGSNRTISFATNAAMVSRLTGSTPSLTPGKYKVVGRVTPAAGSTFALQLTINSVVGLTARAAGTGGVTYQERWVDLGDFSVPTVVPRNKFTGGSNTYSLDLAAQRLSGAGTLGIDHLLFIPLYQKPTIDARAVVKSIGFTTQVAILDGDTEEAWLTTGGNLAAGSNEFSGSCPRVVPGAVNVLWIVPQLSSTEAGNLLTNTASVTVRYYPRYLTVPES